MTRAQQRDAKLTSFMTSPLPPLVAPWRIGVDVGGTFTDMVLRDSAGAVRIYKAPSVPADPSEGVLGVLRLAAQQLDLPLTALLRDCALFVHGSTVATNTILEKKGAKVGMLTTEGFRDSLEIRRGIRENQWDHRAPFPPVLAPRYLRLPVRGRIGADGKELAPLVAGDVDAAARVFADEGVESVAVCLFNSFLDGAHEHAVGAQLAKSWTGKWISLSSEVMPTMGEYERGSTAVVNAYIAPKVTSYLGALDAQLRQLGLPHSLLLLQSNGGAVSVAQIANRPVMLVLSGPAAGVGALKGCAAPGETANLISMEIGGTSCDVMVMARGQVPVADELVIDGYHLTTPSVEIHTVGAGGGAIAWVDDAGLLHVGPQGAGARPGPAAYGLGGEQPTVTDAQLVLGRLRPGPLAGGAVTLDGALARKAVEHKLAKPLGLSVEDAAAGVIRLLEQNLLHAVERLSIERGHNPATFTLVAAGGAGPMHGTAVARALGCSRALLPRAAGAFCALGMLQSDVRQDYLQVFLADLDKVDRSGLDAGFGQLESRARDALAREGFGATAAIEREMDLRYDGQQWPVRVALNGAGFDAAAARQTFEAEHQRLFGHIQPGGRIDITALRVVGRGRLDWTPPAARAPQTTSPKPRERRKVWIDPAHGWREVPIYDGADLRPGCKLEGPLLIEERTMTAFVGPRDRLEVDARDDFLIHVGAAS
jgi:N-methylhydantoinase A